MTHTHLVTSLSRSDQLAQIMSTLNTVFGNKADILGNMADAARPDFDATELDRRLPSAETLAAEFGLLGIDPARMIAAYPEQQSAFADITSRTSGMILLTGGPGSGKVSFCVDDRSCAYELFVDLFTIQSSTDFPHQGFGTPLPVCPRQKGPPLSHHGGRSPSPQPFGLHRA